MLFFNAFPPLCLLLLLASPALRGDELFEIKSDQPDALHLVYQSPEKPLRRQIRPKAFPVRKNARYIVDSATGSAPFVVTAEADDVLNLTLPPEIRAHVAISPEPGGNLLSDGGFESAAGPWKISVVADRHVVDPQLPQPSGAIPVRWRKPAEDTMQIVGGVGRNNSKALTVRRNSHFGTTLCRSEVVRVKPGRKYRASYFSQVRSADLDAGFGLYVWGGDAGAKKRLLGTDCEYTAYPAFPASPGEWRYSVLELNVPGDWKSPELQLEFRTGGHKIELAIDDVELRVAPVAARWEGLDKHVPPQISESELADRLAKSPAHTARVRMRNTRPVLEVDGEIVPAIFYCTRNSAGVVDGASQGVNLAVVVVNTNYWLIREKSIWQGPGRFDFSHIDRELKRTLLWNPDAKIIVSLQGGAYNEFAADHANSRWVDGGGKSAKFNCTVPEEAYSYVSDEVRSEFADAFRRIGEHIAKSPYGKAVIGVHFTFGSDGQWYPATYPRSHKNFDYSEGTRQGVIAELCKLYHDDTAALRRAWQDDKVDFSSARMPAEAEYATAKIQLDPADGRDRRLIDMALAYHRAIVRSIDFFCAQIKKAVGRPILAGTYYTAVGGVAHEELLRCENLDFYVTPGSYMRNRAEGGFTTTGRPLGSARLHGKLFIEEVDYRNEYSANGGFHRDSRNYLGLSDRGVEGYFNQLRRTFGGVLADGHGAWFMTMGNRNHFQWSMPYTPIVGEVRRAAAALLTSPPVEDWGRIAVFYDEKQQLYYTYRDRFDHFFSYINQGAEKPLAYSGLAWQRYYLSDLDHPARPKASINLFPAATGMTDGQVEWIEKNLQKDGNILVFFNDAGRVAAGGFEKNIFRLSGIRVKSRPEILHDATYAPSAGFSDPLAAELPNMPIYCATYRAPLLYVDDPTATPLALLRNSNLVGAAVKRHKNWTAVYFAGGAGMSLTPDFLRKLAREAGAKPSAAPGDVFYGTNGLLVVHAAAPGEKYLQWQGEADLLDLSTGRIVARKVEHYRFRAGFGETRWFLRLGGSGGKTH